METIFFYNFIISVILSLIYVFLTPDTNIYFSLIALVSNVATVYLLLYIILFFLTLPFKNKKFKFFIVSIPLYLLQLLTLTDIVLYNIFKYHINGLVLNVIFTPGGLEALDLPVSNLIYFFIVALFFMILEIFIILKSLKSERKFKKIKYIIFTLILLIVTDKLLFAYFDVKGNNSIIKVEKMYPLYLPFTCKKFAKKVLHMKIKKNFNVKLSYEKNELNYPLSSIRYKHKEKYPNIIWILLDAWRSDAFSEELTPNIFKFSEKSLVFKKHKSGGIATRYGVFSLFYGIYGTYWRKFLENKRSPVFLDFLQKLNYDFKILTSSPLTFPEFDQTVFVKLRDKIKEKRIGKTAAEKDLKITNNFISWIKSRKNNPAPFFSFIFMDAPHAKSYLPEFRKFKSDKNSNYLIIDKKNITKLKNGYLNGVITDDFLVGKILSTLDKYGFLKNSIVLISSDHGEEFYEHGHLGHTSAFTPEQNNVPLILYLPGKTHKNYMKLTCHYDIIPTIMDILGVTSPVTDYSNGINLLNKKHHKFVVASSWTNFAVIYPDYRFIFSVASYKAGLFETRDNNFKLIKDRNLLNSRIKDFAKIIFIKRQSFYLKIFFIS